MLWVCLELLNINITSSHHPEKNEAPRRKETRNSKTMIEFFIKFIDTGGKHV